MMREKAERDERTGRWFLELKKWELREIRAKYWAQKVVSARREAPEETATATQDERAPREEQVAFTFQSVT